MDSPLAEIRFYERPPEGIEQFLVEPGDLLFTRYNGTPELVGVCAVVRTVTQPTAHPDKLIRVKVIPSLCLPDYVEIAANVGASRDFIGRRVRTTAGQAGVSGGDIRATPVPLPPLAEQTQIADEVQRSLSMIRDAEAGQDNSFRRASRLRQSILKRAFEGKLVPQDPTDEPASVLLNRIRAERSATEARREAQGATRKRIPRKRLQKKG